jgi:hypothetical protein
LFSFVSDFDQSGFRRGAIMAEAVPNDPAAIAAAGAPFFNSGFGRTAAET